MATIARQPEPNQAGDFLPVVWLWVKPMATMASSLAMTTCEETPFALLADLPRKRLTWTEEENRIILSSVRRLGTQWELVAAQLPPSRPGGRPAAV